MLIKYIKKNTSFTPDDLGMGVTIIALLRYSLRLDNSSQCQRRMNAVFPRRSTGGGLDSAQDVRLTYERSFYTCIQMRGFACAVLLDGTFNQRVVLAQAKRYGITRLDAIWVAAWLSQCDSLKELTSAAKANKQFLDVRAVERQTMNVFERLQKAVRYRVRKSLAFLTARYNVEAEDLELEVLDQIIPKFLRAAPFDSDHHALNFLKQYASRRVNNVRDYYLAQKRKRFNDYVDSNGEWAATQVYSSENQLRVDSDGNSVTVEDVGYDSGIELSLSLKQAVSCIGEKEQKFVAAIMGVEIPQFTRWLRRRKLLKGGATNSDLTQEHVLKFASRWLRMKAEAVASLFAQLRENLGDSCETPYAYEVAQ